MKQKDIALLVVIVILAGAISLVVSQNLFLSGKNKSLTAEKVDVIEAKFQQPDKTIFNQNAINPTQLIQIGDTSNPQPF